MTTLYILYALMLCVALSLIAMPTLKNKKIMTFFSASTLMIFLIVSLFIVFGGSHQLKLWLEGGEQHYALLQQVKKLGGMDVIIQGVKDRIKANPQDAKGWFILGKLYLSNQEIRQARDALSKAYELDPNNVEIKKYYDLAKD